MREAGSARRVAVCWRCYTKGSHLVNSCVMDFRSHEQVVALNFEALTNAEKANVSWGPYLALKGFLHAGNSQETEALSNPFSLAAHVEPTGKTNRELGNR